MKNGCATHVIKVIGRATKGENQHQIELPHPHQSLPHKLIVINVIAVTTIAAAEIEAASSEIFREVNHPASSKCRSADPSM